MWGEVKKSARRRTIKTRWKQQEKKGALSLQNQGYVQTYGGSQEETMGDLWSLRLNTNRSKSIWREGRANHNRNKGSVIAQKEDE